MTPPSREKLSPQIQERLKKPHAAALRPIENSMITPALQLLRTALAVATLLLMPAAWSQVPGGYSPAPVNDPQVQAAAVAVAATAVVAAVVEAAVADAADAAAASAVVVAPVAVMAADTAAKVTMVVMAAAKAALDMGTAAEVVITHHAIPTESIRDSRTNRQRAHGSLRADVGAVVSEGSRRSTRDDFRRGA